MLKKNKLQQSYDVIIIGAGINGCGIARELSKQSLAVLVIDKSYIGSGTSSKSSRLIHGGLRYLETFQFKLVREALLDQQDLLQMYPDFVKLNPFYLPIYESNPRPAWLIWLGLKLYDTLAGKHQKYHSEKISRYELAKHAPFLTQQGLKAVFRYYDAKTNDLKLTEQVAQDARLYGATIWENININSITNDDSHFQVVTKKGLVSSPILINATGPWINEVNELYKLPADYKIRKISGIHIVIKGILTNEIMFMQTNGKRIFFIIPEHENNHTLIGTTEREETVPVDQVGINEEDVRYLIDNINTYLEPEYQINRDKVIDAFIGVRPLIAHKNNPTDLSREYELDLQLLGNCQLLHIFGGKLTTFLSLARKVSSVLEIKNTPFELFPN